VSRSGGRLIALSMLATVAATVAAANLTLTSAKEGDDRKSPQALKQKENDPSDRPSPDKENSGRHSRTSREQNGHNRRGPEARGYQPA